jgi:hypothetical protein
MKIDKDFSYLSLVVGSSRLSHADEHGRALQELAKRLDKNVKHKRGHLVRWKPGLKNRERPAYGEPAIVRSVIDPPLFDPSAVSAGSPYFQEPLSLVVGIQFDGEFSEFRVDGRRFKPFRSA